MKTAIGFFISCGIIFTFPAGAPLTATTFQPMIGDTAIKKERTLLALGDSYTIGESVAEQLRFPAQAATLLHDAGVAITTVDYVARTGWTTLDLSAAIKNATLQPTYDYVTLLIGVNDQYQHVDIAQYPQHFTSLLTEAIRYAGEKHDHVVVVSIPDYSITPFVAPPGKEIVRSEIAAYNTINKETALHYGCAYIDINDVYRQGAGDPELIAGDQLHPSGKEYYKWSAKLAGYIRTLQ